MGRSSPTAIHDGNGLRAETRAAMALSDADRLREEDPYTGQAIVDVPNHVIAGRSRFEVDLNRAAELAVYRTPEQSWGMKVWKRPPGAGLVERSLLIHKRFYATMGAWLGRGRGRSWALRPARRPQLQSSPLGPGRPSRRRSRRRRTSISAPSRCRATHWAWLLDPLIEAMRGLDFGGRRLDVRENVAFQGKGELTRFVHARYPE